MLQKPNTAAEPSPRFHMTLFAKQQSQGQAAQMCREPLILPPVAATSHSRVCGRKASGGGSQHGKSNAFVISGAKLPPLLIISCERSALATRTHLWLLFRLVCLTRRQVAPLASGNIGQVGQLAAEHRGPSQLSFRLLRCSAKRWHLAATAASCRKVGLSNIWL